LPYGTYYQAGNEGNHARQQIGSGNSSPLPRGGEEDPPSEREIQNRWNLFDCRASRICLGIISLLAMERLLLLSHFLPIGIEASREMMK
jgi:hypothetical protein